MFRNQQVAGSTPAGGSIKIKKLLHTMLGNGWYFGWYSSAVVGFVLLNATRISAPR